jgi:pimeloyl-ACP methyl ester carboxylesterase
MTVVYIHGASATAESFNHIREHIKLNDIAIEYDSNHGFQENLEEMKEVIQKYNNVKFVCHSLGGIYALHLANTFPTKIKGAVTLSTPYGGAEVADYAKYFLPFSRLMRDIGPNSWPMKTAKRLNISHPWTNIVSISGKSPWMNVPNDGVVTISSMKAREKDMEIIEIDVNHYEIVMSNQVLDIIKKKLTDMS